MKTILPTTIKTIQQAKEFLTELYHNEESFHPEDDAFDIVWSQDEPSERDKHRLNSLMEDIYELEMNPCEFLLNLREEYIKENNHEQN
jgi:hypothetical protein